MASFSCGFRLERCVSEHHHAAARLRQTAWTYCFAGPYRLNTPFFAASELLRRLFGADPDSPPGTQLASLEAALTSAGVKADRGVPLVAPLLGLPVPPGLRAATASTEHERLLETLVDWVLGTAGRQPLVALLEDLQWADPSTLELQAQLAERGAEVPLFLLFTARPEFRAPWPLRAHHTHLTLNRLSRREVRELVEHTAGVKLPAREADMVVARTGGVPVFVEELAKTLREAWTTTLQEVPARIEDSLSARLHRLGADAVAVAQAAAVDRYGVLP